MSGPSFGASDVSHFVFFAVDFGTGREGFFGSGCDGFFLQLFPTASWTSPVLMRSLNIVLQCRLIDSLPHRCTIAQG